MQATQVFGLHYAGVKNKTLRSDLNNVCGGHIEK